MDNFVFPFSWCYFLPFSSPSWSYLSQFCIVISSFMWISVVLVVEVHVDDRKTGRAFKFQGDWWLLWFWLRHTHFLWEYPTFYWASKFLNFSGVELNIIFKLISLLVLKNFSTARKSGKISHILKAFFVRHSSEYETSDSDRKVIQNLHSQMRIHMVSWV